MSVSTQNEAPAPARNQRLLQVLVFVSGLSVMAVEMTGLRLLAPFFGTSLIVTTVLIGSMMGFLSLGYALGGRWGDQRPTLQALSKVTAAASVSILLIPFLGQPILRGAAAVLRPLLEGKQLDEPTVAVAMLVGGTLGTIGLFALPVTLMGTVSPWAVRLAVADVENAGRAAGRLYALSTFGSILGSFLPALVLVPALGVRNTFLFVGALLLAVSAVGLIGGLRAALAPTAALSLMIVPPGVTRPMEGLILEEESLYHFIQVVREPYGKSCPDALHLYLNEGVGVHSVKCMVPGMDIRGVWTYMATMPFYFDDLAKFNDVLIIGLAGGTIARQMLQAFPEIQVDGVEIDGAVVEVGKKYLDNEDPRIRPIVMDGRIFLQLTEKKYDLVMMDAYRQPYIPFHLVTTEFFEEVKAHLTEDGLVAVNVASVRGISQRLGQMIYRTLKETFPTVVVIEATTSNTVILASMRAKDLYLAADQLEALSPAPVALAGVQKQLRKKIVADIPGWEGARLLTDDQAPVEQAWDLMALEYAK
jgi:predicted membrane-bound spermidine synthase